MGAPCWLGPQVARKASPSVRRVAAVRPQSRARATKGGDEEPVFDTLKTSTTPDDEVREIEPTQPEVVCGARHR